LTDEDTVLATITSPSNDPPVADAGPDRSAKIDQTITFDAIASHDPDGEIVGWNWDFGDSATAAGQTVTHSYAAEGTYLVILTVTDDDGALGQDSVLVTVGKVVNNPPVADAGEDRTVTLGQEILLDGSKSTDADGTIVTWVWDLGNGETGTGEAFQHTYQELGTYKVKLTVTDDSGLSDDDFVMITVQSVESSGGGCGCAAGGSLGGGLTWAGLALLAMLRRRR
jgi:uncharacterized protein (TIGR03382 family)